MTRQVNIKGIFIHANATSCANHCRYCQLTSSRPRKISIERYAALIHRFLDWKEQSNPHFEIHPWFGNSYDHDISVVKIIRQIENRLDNRCKNFLLGGLSHRSLNEMRQWIAERHQQGLDTLVATFSGYQKDHNYWNNYPDNYQFQLDCLRLVASMGLKTQQRILLLRSSLSSLESVLDDLDSIQPHIRERWAIPLFYSGQARRVEYERLTESDFQSLPERISDILREDKTNWRAEYRWIDYVLQHPVTLPQTVNIPLRINDASLTWAENHSCDEIVNELTVRALVAYQQMPSQYDLCLRYADNNNDKVYFNLAQMERLWLERYFKDNPNAFDINATHFG